MASRSSRSIVRMALLAALLVVGLNTWFAVSAVHALTESESWLAHTWEVIGHTDELEGSITRAESTARGYSLSGKDMLLNEYTAMKSQLMPEIDALGTLTADNPIQQANIADLRKTVAERFVYQDEVVTARKNGSLALAGELTGTLKGATQMVHAHAVLTAMDAEEQRLLTSRASEVRQNGSRVMFAIGLACVLDLLMIGSVIWYLGQERELRLAAEQSDKEARAARVEAERSAAEVLLVNSELERRVAERTAELESTNRELEAFSYSVSHDLRAPLRTIDGFSLALSEDYADVVDEAGRDYINRVRAGVQRMGQLIDALLQLSRITRADVVRETVQPAAIAEKVVQALREENPERNLTFTVTPGPTAEADPKLLQVALENLLGNAVKFTGRRENAEISFGWDAEQSAWRVKDNGAGFDMHYKDKLFNAFNRLHGDKDFKGSGIGLATVARVIRRHHGRIWADSTLDHGATFWFTLG